MSPTFVFFRSVTLPSPPVFDPDQFIAVGGDFDGSWAVTTEQGSFTMTYTSTTGRDNAFVQRVTTAGSLVWSAYFTNTNQCEVYTLDVDTGDGSVYAAVNYWIDSGVTDSENLLIYNGDGTLHSTYTGPTEITSGSGQLWHSLIIKFSADTGTVQWVKGFGSHKIDYNYPSVALPHGPFKIVSLKYNETDDTIRCGLDSDNGDGSLGYIIGEGETYEQTTTTDFTGNNDHAMVWNINASDGTVVASSLVQSYQDPISTNEIIIIPTRNQQRNRGIDVEVDSNSIYVALMIENDSGGSRTHYWDVNRASKKAIVPFSAHFYGSIVKANSLNRGIWQRTFIVKDNVDADVNGDSVYISNWADNLSNGGVISTIHETRQSSSIDHFSYYGGGGGGAKLGEIEVLNPLTNQTHSAIFRLDADGYLLWSNTFDALQPIKHFVDDQNGFVYVASYFANATDDLAWGNGTPGGEATFNQTLSRGTGVSKWNAFDGSFQWAALVHPNTSDDSIQPQEIFVDQDGYINVLARLGFEASGQENGNVIPYNSSAQGFTTGTAINRGNGVQSLGIFRWNQDGTLADTEYVNIWDRTTGDPITERHVVRHAVRPRKIFNDTTPPTASNFLPTDGYSEATVSTAIAFDIVDDVSNVDISSIDVYLNGSFILQNGVAVAGYSVNYTSLDKGYTVTLSGRDLDGYETYVVDGYASDIYGNQTTAQWTFSTGFYLPPPPGNPFADYIAQNQTAGTLTSWENEGSDATGDLNTNPGALADPEVIDDGYSGPLPLAKYVSFSNTEALQGSLTTSRLTGVVFAGVIRMPGPFVNASRTVVDGDGASTRMAFWTRNESVNYDWNLHSGSSRTASEAHERDKWIRVCGQWGNPSIFLVEGANRSGTTSSGTNGIGGITFGSNHDATSPAGVDIARMTYWDDGTTVADAQNWIEQAYPFAPVPPGNPRHHWDPNDYPVGPLTQNVIDKGSDGVNLATTGMSIILDPDCPEQKVFDFSNGASAMTDTLGTTINLNADDPPDLAWAFVVRSTQDSTQETIMEDRGTGEQWFIHLDSINQVGLNTGGTTRDSIDLDTAGVQDTRLRWVSLFLRGRESSSDIHYHDGISFGGGGGSSGVDQPNSIQIGSASFSGRLSDILIYQDVSGDVYETNTERPREVHEWFMHWRRLRTTPGSPFIDLDIGSLDLLHDATVSTWANDGSEGDLVQATVSEQPLFQDNDGPEPSVRDVASGPADGYINFDPSANQHLESAATFSTKTQVGAAAVVFRPRTLPSTDGYYTLASSDTEGASWNVIVAESSGSLYSRANAGLDLDAAVDLTRNQWHWIVAEFNGASSHIIDSAGGSTSGDAGPDSHGTKQLIGHDATGANDFDGDLVKVVYWDDGTTMEQAEDWIENRYRHIIFD